MVCSRARVSPARQRWRVQREIRLTFVLVVAIAAASQQNSQPTDKDGTATAGNRARPMKTPENVYVQREQNKDGATESSSLQPTPPYDFRGAQSQGSGRRITAYRMDKRPTYARKAYRMKETPKYTRRAKKRIARVRRVALGSNPLENSTVLFDSAVWNNNSEIINITALADTVTPTADLLGTSTVALLDSQVMTNSSEMTMNLTSLTTTSNRSHEYLHTINFKRFCQSSTNGTENKTSSENGTHLETDKEGACETHETRAQLKNQTSVSNKPANPKKAAKGTISFAEIIAYFKIFRTITIIPLSMALVSTVISVLVLYHQKIAHQAKVMLIAFIFSDGCKSLSYLTNRVFRVIVHDTPLTWQSAYSTYFTTVVLWLPDSLGRISLLINSFLVAERFYSIAFPFAHKTTKFLCYKFPKILVSVVVVSMCLFQTSTVVLFYVDAAPKLNWNQTFQSTNIVKVIAVSAPQAFYTYQVCQTVAAVLFRYIPMCVALILNILTIISLVLHQRRHNKQLAGKIDAEQSQPQSQRRRQTNIMIVTSSTLYTILVSLKPMVRIISTFLPDFGQGKKETNMYLLTDETFLFLDSMTPITNLVIYFTLSFEFRKTFAMLIMQGRQTTGTKAFNSSKRMSQRSDADLD